MPHEPTNMERATILVVEDNPITRKMLRLALEAEGYVVLEAPDAAAALELAAERAPDLVVQDLLLPDMDGLELANRLRAGPQAAEIPIIALTGFLSMAAEPRAAATFNQFLIKPVEPSRLIEIIAAYLRTPYLESRAGAQDRPGSGKRVLIADDDPIQLKLMRHYLAQLGFEVESATNGADAFELARTSQPDVILSDVLMPGLDGFSLCHAVRREPSLAGMPVVLTSSQYIEDADLRLATKLGASAYIPRTEGLEKLTRAILDALEERPPKPPPDAVEVETDHVQRILKQLERQTAMNVGLVQKCSLQAAVLSVLGAISDVLARDLDIQALGDVVAQWLDAAGLSMGAIYVTGPDGRPVMQARVGHSTPGQEELDSFFGHLELLERAMDSAMVVAIPSPEVPDATARDFLRRSRVTGALIVPLLFREERMGAVLMGSAAGSLASSEWLAFVGAFTAQIGQSIALSRSFARLTASERRYRSLMENANDAIFLLRPSGEIVEINHRAEELLALPSAEIVGRRILDFQPADKAEPGAEGESAPSWGALQGGSGNTEGVRLSRADGQEVRVDISTSELELGSEPLILAIARDVTERYAAQRRLLEQASLASLVAEVNVTMVRADELSFALGRCTEAVVRHLGAAAARIWTLNSSDNALELKTSAGMVIRTPGHSDRVPVGQQTIGLIAQEREPYFTNSLAVDTQVGDDLEWARGQGIVAFVGHPLVVEEKLVGVLETFFYRPFTNPAATALSSIADAIAAGIRRKTMAQEQAALQQQLLKAQKLDAIGKLAGGVAHDFNNILVAILGNAGLLLDELDEGDSRREIAEEIRQAGERAAALTSQLLAFSRQQMLEMRVVDLNAVAAGMERMVKRLIGEDITMEMALDPELGRVKADSTHLEQVIMNLALNARDAMAPGGTLTIATANVDLEASHSSSIPDLRPGSYVMLSVSDTGYGMDGTTLAQIFEPFFTTKEGKGSGLGLSTVHGIVMQSGGYITVDSEVGGGTTFKIYLPRVDEAPALLAQGAGRELSARGIETVLVVDDDERVLSVIRKVLGAKGYALLEAHDGEEAISVFERRVAEGHGPPIDLVLTDVVMPGISGTVVAERLRAQKPGLKVLFMSGYTDHPAFHTPALAARTNFLRKPFTPEGLAAKVREVLSAPTPDNSDQG